MNKKHIGDGVYMEIDTHGNIILTTEGGFDEPNKIILEPEVIAEFLTRVATALRRAMPNQYIDIWNWYIK